MLSQVQKATTFSVPELTPQEKVIDAVQLQEGTDIMANTKALRRQEAGIKSIEDYNKRPKKTQITPSTRGVEYAMYSKLLWAGLNVSELSIFRMKMAQNCMENW